MMRLRLVLITMRRADIFNSENKFIYFFIQQHHEQCHNFPVTCSNKNCLVELKRCEVGTASQFEANLSDLIGLNSLSHVRWISVMNI